MGNMNKEKLFRGGYLHLDGGLALLKARKEYGGADDHSRTLDRHIRRQMVRVHQHWEASMLRGLIQNLFRYGLGCTVHLLYHLGCKTAPNLARLVLTSSSIDAL